jgi:tetratricopeptide (TPR) repeat protein
MVLHTIVASAARITALLSLLLTSACVTSQDSAKIKDEQVILGNQYARDGLFREAAETYRKSLESNPKNTTAQRNLGMVLVKLGQYKEAAKNLEAALPSYNQDFDLHWYLGEAHRGQQRYSDAIFYYQAALRIKPQQVRALKSLAWSYFKIRFYSAALDTAKQLRKQDPKDTQTALILARILVKVNKPSAALQVIQKAKAQAPKENQPYLLSVEGDIYISKNDCAQASAAYRKALESQPLLAGALLGYGRCFYRNKNFEKAAEYMTRAVRVRPTLSEGYYYLGRIYESKEPKTAARYYRRFHQTAANDPQMSSMIADMKSRYQVLKKKL